MQLFMLLTYFNYDKLHIIPHLHSSLYVEINQVFFIYENLDVQCTHLFHHISEFLWTLTGEWGSM
jgi:hypothetical protein